MFGIVSSVSCVISAQLAVFHAVGDLAVYTDLAVFGLAVFIVSFSITKALAGCVFGLAVCIVSSSITSWLSSMPGWFSCVLTWLYLVWPNGCTNDLCTIIISTGCIWSGSKVLPVVCVIMSTLAVFGLVLRLYQWSK